MIFGRETIFFTRFHLAILWRKNLKNHNFSLKLLIYRFILDTLSIIKLPNNTYIILNKLKN